MARPTTYDDEMLSDALSYIDQFNMQPDQRDEIVHDEVIPSIVGLARYIKRAKSTIYKWVGEEGKEEFSDIVSTINELQELKLLSGGLAGGYNPMISKLILSKHGYHDKAEIDNKSSDGSMSPKAYSQDQYAEAQKELESDLTDLD